MSSKRTNNRAKKKSKIHPQGSGFGGKKKDAQESGKSHSYAHVLYALSEGTIEGPIGWLKGINLNEVPAQNEQDVKGKPSYNFKHFGGDFRPGSSEQSPMAGFGDEIASEVGVGVEVKHERPVTRFITNPDVDLIRVRLSFQLEKTGKSIEATDVTFQIYIKEGRQGFQLRLEQNIRGRYSSPVEMERDFPVNNFGGTVNNFAVRVERLTAQDTDPNHQRIVVFKAFAEIVSAKLSYPHTALLGLQYDAQEFDSIPQLGAKIGGRLIQIPTNAVVANDRGLDYTGTWDGTFYNAPIATACPAWIFYDLLTSTRYGLGKYINVENIDKWSLYSLSKYCNEMIFAGGYTQGDYGEGLIYERRFQCNVLLEGKEQAYDVIKSFQGIFRGFSYWSEAVLRLEADRRGVPTAIVTQADIQDGTFTYSTTPLRSRHTVARVSWNDRDELYKPKYESVEDQAGIDKYGWRETEFAAFATTTRGQAYRAGWAALLSERLEVDLVRFRIRPYGAYFRPGKRIKIMDSVRSDPRYSGLIVDCSPDTMTIDFPIAMPSGQSYVVTFMRPDGEMIERSVSALNSNSGTSELRISPSLSSQEIPVPESPWILASDMIKPRIFTLITVTQVEGEGGLLYECSGINYVDEKYEKIDADYFLSISPPYPQRPSKLPEVLSLKGALEEKTPTDCVLLANWGKPNDFVTGYSAQYQVENGEWTGEQQSSYTSTSWVVPQDIYNVRVAAFDFEGRFSDWIEAKSIKVIQAMVLDLKAEFGLKDSNAIALKMNFNLGLDYTHGLGMNLSTNLQIRNP